MKSEDQTKMLKLENDGIYIIQPMEDMTNKQLDELTKAWEKLRELTGGTWAGLVLPSALTIEDMQIDALLHMRGQIDKLIAKRLGASEEDGDNTGC